MLFTPVEAFSVVRIIEFPAKCWLHQEIECLTPIIGLVKFDDEWGIGHEHDVFLIHNALLHPCLYDVAFTQAFQCVSGVSGCMLPEFHSTKSTTTQSPSLTRSLLRIFSRLPSRAVV